MVRVHEGSGLLYLLSQDLLDRCVQQVCGGMVSTGMIAADPIHDTLDTS